MSTYTRKTGEKNPFAFIVGAVAAGFEEISPVLTLYEQHELVGIQP